jgi:hypothetical protein
MIPERNQAHALLATYQRIRSEDPIKGEVKKDMLGHGVD